MPAATTIVELCDAITAGLRSRGFFDEHVDDAARHAAVHEAVDEASRELGLKLTLSEKAPGSGHTVLAEEVPGMVTIVSQRRVAAPGEAQGDAQDSINPDFGVTWSLA
jgi:hypothetical protein